MQLTKEERQLIDSGAVLVRDATHRQYTLGGELFTLSRARRMTSCQESTFKSKLRRALRRLQQGA